MNLIAAAREELAKIRARFYDLVEPEKQIAEKVEAFVHTIADHVEAKIAEFEARFKALEEHMHAVSQAPAIASDVATFHPPQPPAPAPDASAAADAAAEASSPAVNSAAAPAADSAQTTEAAPAVPTAAPGGDSPREESAGTSSIEKE